MVDGFRLYAYSVQLLCDFDSDGEAIHLALPQLLVAERRLERVCGCYGDVGTPDLSQR